MAMSTTPRQPGTRRLYAHRRPLASCAAGVVMLAIAAVTRGASPVEIHVSPAGDDAERGLRWDTPVASIQRALDLAQPGQRIVIHPGEYYEDPRTRRDGRDGAPIRLEAAPGAVLRGAGAARVFEIKHSHIEVLNLQIDGEIPASRGGGYRDKLIYIMGRDARTGIRGVRLLYLDLRNAGGECVRMKYYAHHNELAWSSIVRCGIEDFERGGGGKNGEAIYIGTAPEQLDRNPSPDLDASDGNWIHHNRIDTRGNECVDIKEGARFNVVEFNRCTGQLDEKAGGLSVRGNDNILRFNLVYGNRGAGIRLGGDTEADGIGNHVYGNLLGTNAFSAFKMMNGPQARICGNRRLDAGSPLVRGSHREGIRPLEPCS